MKVSAVKALITKEDIFGVIDEYVDIEGLTIKDIIINDIITISGSYKKGIEVPFKAEVGLGNIHENKVNLKLFNVSVAKLGILKGVKNFALKKVLKDFSENGIIVDGDTITVDLNLISKIVPFVYFNLKSINILKDAIEVEVEDVVYAPDKEVKKFKKNKTDKQSYVKKFVDGYSRTRDNIQSNIPEKYKGIVEYAMIVPDVIAMLCRMFRDKRVNLQTKVMIGGAIAYLASPIDILPDFIPFVGKIDDVAIAFFVMNKLINEVPEDVILENWNGREDIITVIKNGVYYISNLVGGKNVEKLVDFIKNLGKKKEIEEKVYEEGNNIH